MTDELLALIKHRLKQADDSIEEAKVLLREKMSLRSVMNRLYYSMFYAVLALLQEKQLGTSKHIGAISLFDREFIKIGIFDKGMSILFIKTTAETGPQDAAHGDAEIDI